MLNNIKGWRTVIANAIMSVPPVIETLRSEFDISDEIQSGYSLLVIVVNLFLRSVTNTRIGDKG